MFPHLLHDTSAMQLQRFSQFSIFTEFYVLADFVIDIISKMKKSGGTSRDSDQGRTYKSGSEKRKLKPAGDEMLKKHTKITTLLKSDTGEVNKEQGLAEKRIEEECALVLKKTISSKKGNILDLLL